MKLEKMLLQENAELKAEIIDIRHLKQLKKKNRELKKTLRGLNR